MDTYGEIRNVYKILLIKSVEKTPLGGPRYRWKDRINTVLEELGCMCVDWIRVAGHQRWTLVNAILNLWIPYEMGNFLTS